MRLAQAQAQVFHQNGYLVVENALGDEDFNPLIADFEALIATVKILPTVVATYWRVLAAMQAHEREPPQPRSLMSTINHFDDAKIQREKYESRTILWRKGHTT